MGNRKSVLMLLLTATIWGVAFVAQSVGMDYVGPFTFNGVRSLIGGAVLIPVLLWSNRRGKNAAGKPLWRDKTLWTGGALCGVVLFLASSAQQIGLVSTSAGKAGFITAFYIVLVPVFGLYLGRRCAPVIWLSVAMALVGLYLLCINESFAIAPGDLWVLLCAALFAVHILVIDHYAPKTNGVAMSCIQFFVCGALSMGMMLFTEQPTAAGLAGAAVPILYAGVLSCGVAYTLQILGQKDMNPTVASLILSLESCISVLAGWLILGQALRARELIGCVILFAAILLAQLPAGNKSRDAGQ